MLSNLYPSFVARIFVMKLHGIIFNSIADILTLIFFIHFIAKRHKIVIRNIM